MATVNEELFDALVRHQIGLTRLGASTAADLIDSLNTYDKRIITILRTLDASTSRTRMDKALREIRKINIDAYLRIEREMTRAFKKLAKAEVDYNLKATTDAMPKEARDQVKLKKPKVKVLNSMVTKQPMNGALLEEHVNGMEVGRYNRIRDLIRREIQKGGTNTAVSTAIVQGIVGTAPTRFKDGLLDYSRRSLEQVTRTLTNGVANLARGEFTKQNDDIFDGEQWVSVLDNKTSAICQALDGTVFPLGEGPQPPAHPNCRSERVPVVKDWKKMGLDDLGPGTRESMNGEVPETQTYTEWLRDQPNHVQDDILGPSRGALFREHRISLDRFVDDSGRRWTLDELASQGLF